MNKIKFYSTLGLLTLSASLLVGCGSSQNESTVESATKTSQTTSSQEKAKASSSKSKEKTTVPPKTTAQTTKEDNVEVSTETENNQVAAEQSTIAPTEEIVATPAQEVTETPTTPVQETTSAEAATLAPVSEVSSSSNLSREDAKRIAQELLERIPQDVELDLATDTGKGGWYDAILTEELEKIGYWDKYYAALEEAKANQ